MTIKLWVVTGFAGVLLLGGFFAPLDTAVRIASILSATGLMIAVLYGKENVETVELSNDGFKIRFHNPPEEKKILSQFSQDKASPEILEKAKPLIEEANNRTDAVRSAEDYLALATENWRAKNHDKAFQFVYAGLSLNPKDKRLKATLIYRKASIFKACGLIEYAIKFNNEAIKLDPEFSWPRISMGNIYVGQGKMIEAEAEYKEAIRTDPELGP
jgi:tetratricopeptide (TPR) repeat protein